MTQDGSVSEERLRELLAMCDAIPDQQNPLNDPEPNAEDGATIEMDPRELRRILRSIRAGEPVGWQWSDYSGKWYTVDTARLPLAEQETMARVIADKCEGRVRPLYALPPAPVLPEGWQTDMSAMPWAVTLLFKDPTDADGMDVVRLGLRDDAGAAIAWAWLPGENPAPTRESVIEECAVVVETALVRDYESKVGMTRGQSEAEVFLARAVRKLKGLYPLPASRGEGE